MRQEATPFPPTPEHSEIHQHNPACLHTAPQGSLQLSSQHSAAPASPTGFDSQKRKKNQQIQSVGENLYIPVPSIPR